MSRLIVKKWPRIALAAAATCSLIAFTLAGFSSSATVDGMIKSLIMTYLGLVVVRAVFFFAGTFSQKLESVRLNRIPDHQFRRPLVSIIVPCFNEQDVIADALESLFQLDYPNVEIIVVNDGSHDATLAIAESLAELSPRIPVRVVSQQNHGKAAALNLGLLNASGDLILCVDADSRLNPSAVEKGVRHFDDPSVGAVAGFITINNQGNVLLLLQQLEYLIGLNFTRRAMSLMGVVPIVPGPAGLFRRKALMSAGGFTTDRTIFAEDAELSLRLLSTGWKIKTEEEMVASTAAPESHRDLLRQRYRWNRGTYQALMMNFQDLMRSGMRGRWVALHLFLESVVSPVLNFGLILYFLSFYFTTGRLEMFTPWYFYLLAIDLLTTTLAVHGEGRLPMWLLLTFFNKVYYFYMLLTWRLFSLYEEWLGMRMTWDKLERDKSSLKEAA